VGLKLRPARWQWATENGKSGLRPRPPGWEPRPGLAAPERDVITAQVPTVVLLEAARAMTEPEPPADLRLYAAAYPEALEDGDLEDDLEGGGLGHPAEPSEEPPRSSRISKPALPLAAEFGLEHLIEADAKPARSWSMWLRAHGPWIAAGMLLLWLVASFALRWLVLLF
jgi:hypothetical protein